MGLTLFTLGSLFAPLQGLVAGLLPAYGNSRALRGQRGVTRTAGHIQRAPRGVASNAAPQRACRPLRVVRFVEPTCAAVDAGRMRISGRMADVCAELDRLAALEAARSSC
jgi:hypothetical protein